MMATDTQGCRTEIEAALHAVVKAELWDFVCATFDDYIAVGALHENFWKYNSANALELAITKASYAVLRSRNVQAAIEALRAHEATEGLAE